MYGQFAGRVLLDEFEIPELPPAADWPCQHPGEPSHKIELPGRMGDWEAARYGCVLGDSGHLLSALEKRPEKGLKLSSGLV
jgi:hypothetical protein